MIQYKLNHTNDMYICMTFSGEIRCFGVIEDNFFIPVDGNQQTYPFYYAFTNDMILFDFDGNPYILIKCDNSEIYYYDHSYQSCMVGKPKRIGYSDIYYYDSSYQSCMAGKVKRVGNTEISYYDSAYQSCMVGKPRRIGYSEISYYDSAYQNCMVGKPDVSATQKFTITTAHISIAWSANRSA